MSDIMWANSVVDLYSLNMGTIFVAAFNGNKHARHFVACKSLLIVMFLLVYIYVVFFSYSPASITEIYTSE